MPASRAMRLALATLLAAALASCASRAPDDQTTRVTFIVVRHAEKVDASRDPDLSPADQARSQALAQQLDGRDLVATRYGAASPAP